MKALGTVGQPRYGIPAAASSSAITTGEGGEDIGREGKGLLCRGLPGEKWRSRTLLTEGREGWLLQL